MNDTLNKRKWKFSKIEHSIQIDGFNCGVFVCIFIERFFKRKSLKFEFSDESLIEYRFRMNTELKKNSLIKFCSLCSFNLKPTEEYLKFDCIHKYHLKCSGRKNIFDNCPQCS